MIQISPWIKSLIYVLLFSALFTVYQAKLVFAQKRLDLDDVSIKGEIHGDDRLKVLAREKNELSNHVKFRTNYRADMVEELPIPKPRVKY